MAIVRCKRCAKNVPSSEVRYVSADAFYCDECYMGHIGKARTKAAPSAERDYDISPVKKSSLLCAKCGFVTRVRPDVQNPACGYCGATELRESEDSAAKLIAEADFDTDE